MLFHMKVETVFEGPRPEGLITIKEAVILSGLTKLTLRNWITKGKLPVAYKNQGVTGALFFRPEDVQAAVDEGVGRTWTPLEERFLSFIESGYGTEECWLWRATSVSPNGYGNFWMDNATRSAHRVAWELWVGPIGDNLTVDHVCHSLDPTCGGSWECLHRRCVNPDHLEVVTMSENILRKFRRTDG